MEALTAFFASILAFFTSLFGCGGSVYPLTTPEDFTPAVRFLVCSDTHINENELYKCDRIKSALDYAYDYASSDEKYTSLDAAMFVGDITDNGTDIQFSLAKDAIQSSVREGTEILAVAAKNHDGYQGKGCLDKVSEISDLDSDFHVVINGFHFIGISTSKIKTEKYGLYQRIWLEKQLAEAAADDPSKPIFICHHEHVSNTVYGSSDFEGWGCSFFKDIFNRYPQIVHFSGHSHYPLNDPRSVYQDKFTCVGTGTMSYVELTIGEDRSIHPTDCDKVAQCWIVEADNENNVLLTGIDVTNGEVLCTRYIPSVVDTGMKPYSEESNTARSKSPEFSDEATINITEATDKDTYEITVPAAKSTDGEIIELYRINIYDTNGKNVHTEYKVNNYWINDTFDNISFTVEAQKGYKVSITAENAYKLASEPLTATIE